MYYYLRYGKTCLLLVMSALVAILDVLFLFVYMDTEILPA